MKNKCIFTVLLLLFTTFLFSCDLSTEEMPNSNNYINYATQEWITKVKSITWVAYSPPTGDPNANIEASIDAIREDLEVLRDAGFSGIVTYGSGGVMGKEFPTIAQSLGFQGIILGIWDPYSVEEISNAIDASFLSSVIGYCVGNEGLDVRYSLEDLALVIDNLHESTGKPATTSEEIDDYLDRELLDLGDWVFPNVHPYFHNQLDPISAVQWTESQFEQISSETERFVMFKEVGLPSAGDERGQISEANQALYYQKLSNSNTLFVYFEAFDQPWKTHLPIEPHWGIFKADHTPKLLGWYLMGIEPPKEHISDKTFYIYKEADSPHNHYRPTGYMGDIGDISIDQVFVDPLDPIQTSIKIIYSAKGKGPYSCSGASPCNWAGVYWQNPPDNWGTNPDWQEEGYDLSKYKRLLFMAKAEQPCTIEFLVGGIKNTYGDSLKDPRKKTVTLTQEWEEIEINLGSDDLSFIIGGFAWVAEAKKNSGGATFYLKNIRFEE
jgi:exo-beta-1,3-glucanase (GH17 family)